MHMQDIYSIVSDVYFNPLGFVIAFPITKEIQNKIVIKIPVSMIFNMFFKLFNNRPLYTGRDALAVN